MKHLLSSKLREQLVDLCAIDALASLDENRDYRKDVARMGFDGFKRLSDRSLVQAFYDAGLDERHPEIKLPEITTTLEGGIEVVLADKDTKPLSPEQEAMVCAVMDNYPVERRITVHETIHGHIVTLKRKSGRYIPGTEDKPARLSLEDLTFLAEFGESLRWVEMASDTVKLGL